MYLCIMSACVSCIYVVWACILTCLNSSPNIYIHNKLKEYFWLLIFKIFAKNYLPFSFIFSLNLVCTLYCTGQGVSICLAPKLTRFSRKVQLRAHLLCFPGFLCADVKTIMLNMDVMRAAIPSWTPIFLCVPLFAVSIYRVSDVFPPSGSFVSEEEEKER